MSYLIGTTTPEAIPASISFVPLSHRLVRSRTSRRLAGARGYEVEMGRLRDTGRDVAYYFGIGEESEATRASTLKQEDWWTVVLRIGPPVVGAMLLRDALGADHGLAGYALLVGLVIVLATAWGLLLCLLRESGGGR